MISDSQERHGRRCRVARLLKGDDDFEACAEACLAQPFCEAVTWFGPSYAVRHLKGSCFGRTAGSPPVFQPHLRAANALAQEESWPINSSVVTGYVHCSPCPLQEELDAHCQHIYAQSQGPCRSEAVARHTKLLDYPDEEDFAWACYARPPEDAPLALMCVDGRGMMSPCTSVNKSRASICRMRGTVSRHEEAAALNHLHDIHRGGCGVPACLSAPASGARLAAEGETLPSPQPPPPPSQPSLPRSEWTRLLVGGETVARRVEVLRRAGYLNCSVTNDETHDTCHRLRPDFDWMGWVLKPSAGKAARAARHHRRNTSAAAHALSWWLAEGSASGGSLDAEAFDPIEFVHHLTALKAASRQPARVVFSGDSTGRQQAVSLCCLLTAGSRLGAPFHVKITVNRAFFNFACNVIGTEQPRRVLAMIDFQRYNRADSFQDRRPPELNPRLNGILLRAIMSAPEVLVLNFGAWEYENGCVDMHSLHDALCHEQLPSGSLGGSPWRHWVLSQYAKKLGLVTAALETAYPPEVRSSKLVVLRLSAPRDFENGTLRTGGRCLRREPIPEAELSAEEATPDRGSRRFAVMSKNVLMLATVAQRTPWVKVLDAYSLARQRADSHPAQPSKPDCLHYCAPGVVDLFNARLSHLLRQHVDEQHVERHRWRDHLRIPALPDATSLLKRWNFRFGDQPFIVGSAPNLQIQVDPSKPRVDLECPPTRITQGGSHLLGFCSDAGAHGSSDSPAKVVQEEGVDSCRTIRVSNVPRLSQV